MCVNMYRKVVRSEFGGNEASTRGANACVGQSLGSFVHLPKILFLMVALGRVDVLGKRQKPHFEWCVVETDNCLVHCCYANVCTGPQKGSSCVGITHGHLHALQVW